MDISHASTCQTCLGSSKNSINLFDSCFKDYLDILQRLLGLQLFVEGGQFIVCTECQSKITFLSKFKISCLKSLERIASVDYKTDFDDNMGPLSQLQNVQEIKVENTADLFGANTEYIPLIRNTPDHDDVSDECFQTNRENKKRKYEGRGNNNDVLEINKNKGDKSSKKIRHSKLQQFPADKVAKAIADFESYSIDPKRTQCIFCDFVGTKVSSVQGHIRHKHVNDYPTWCYRCNMVTQNLQEHIESVKCFEQKCKLCGVTCNKLHSIKRHLERHCSKLYSKPL